MLTWLTHWLRRSPMKVAQDVACVAVPELTTLMEFSNKLQAEEFLCGVPKTLHSFLVIQMAYIHDLIAILVAAASGTEYRQCPSWPGSHSTRRSTGWTMLISSPQV